eukprot:1157599-Pelagomonas_calceolata.AAC.3
MSGDGIPGHYHGLRLMWESVPLHAASRTDTAHRHLLEVWRKAHTVAGQAQVSHRAPMPAAVCGKVEVALAARVCTFASSGKLNSSHTAWP